MRVKILIGATCLTFAALAYEASDAVKQPVYLYLYARATDQVNTDITEQRLHRLLPMVERYRKQHPEAHVSATIFFSGASSAALERTNAQTHTRDFVADYIRRGVIEAGYDGLDEPTYDNRPTVDFWNAQTAQERWKIRKTIAERMLTEGRDPVTGQPQPGTSGGLKKMQEVFGPAACISGVNLWMPFGGSNHAVTPADVPIATPSFTRLLPEVGGDTEILETIRTLNKSAVMFGITEANLGKVAGFGGGRSMFSREMAPEANTAPEVFWQDNVLRTSEASSNAVHPIHLFQGLEEVRKALDKIDRSNAHVVHLELDSETVYMKAEFSKGNDWAALKYGYDHPQQPQLPTEDRAAKTDIDDAYRKTEAALDWLISDFVPKATGSRAVSNAELTAMASPDAGYTVSTEALKTSLSALLKLWGNETWAPEPIKVEDHYLSLANTFQVLTDAFAEYGRTGKFPDRVKVVEVYGPVRFYTGHGVNEGEVALSSVAGLCGRIAPALHEQTFADGFPVNSIPNFVEVDGIKMNPAQFLRIMAKALVNPDPDKKIGVRMTYMYSSSGMMFPKIRPQQDAGFVWTLKPAPFQSSLQASAR